MGIKKIPRLFKLCFIWTFDIAMCFITNLEMDSLKRIGEQTCFFSNNDRLLQICFEHLTLRYVLSQIWIMEILKRIGEDTCPFQMMIGCYWTVCFIWTFDIAMFFITNLDNGKFEENWRGDVPISSYRHVLLGHLTLQYVLSQVWIMESLKRIGEETCLFKKNKCGYRELL